MKRWTIRRIYGSTTSMTGIRVIDTCCNTDKLIKTLHFWTTLCYKYVPPEEFTGEPWTITAYPCKHS